MRQINRTKLIGRLLKYPECCIEFFNNGGRTSDFGVNYRGFIPCGIHAVKTKEQIEKEIGRDLDVDVFPVLDWCMATYDKSDRETFDIGFDMFNKVGKAEEFQDVWLRTEREG